MMFSFIVPCYNSEKTILKCLDSIKMQSVHDFECIMFDDGSTDRTKDILLSFSKSDCRFKYFYHNNMGVSATTNEAIQVSSGKYIIDVDHDDWVEPDLLEYVLLALNIDDFDIIGFLSNIHNVNEAHNVQDKNYSKNIKKFKLFEFGNDYESNIDVAYKKSRLWETHSSTCIKKAVINDVCFVGHGVAADTIVMETLIHKSNSVCFINKELYNRLALPTSISRSKRPDDIFLTQLERRLLFMEPFLKKKIKHPVELSRYMPMYLNERAKYLKSFKIVKLLRLWGIGLKMYKYRDLFYGSKHKIKQALCLLIPILPVKGYYNCD